MINNSPFGRNNTPFIFVIAILIFSHFKDTALFFRYNENVIICVFFKKRPKWMYVNSRKSTRLYFRWNFTVGRFKIHRKYPLTLSPKISSTCKLTSKLFLLGSAYSPDCHVTSSKRPPHSWHLHPIHYFALSPEPQPPSGHLSDSSPEVHQCKRTSSVAVVNFA